MDNADNGLNYWWQRAKSYEETLKALSDLLDKRDVLNEEETSTCYYVIKNQLEKWKAQ